VANGGTQQFTASAKDQFGHAMTASVTWSLTSGIGGINLNSGLYTAPASGTGSATVKATATNNSNVTATATVSVTAPSSTPAAPVLSVANHVLSWTEQAANPAVTSFLIQRFYHGSWHSYATVSASTFSKSVTAGYSYRVIAVNSIGNSVASNTVTG
jgi:hypothetical protein